MSRTRPRWARATPPDKVVQNNGVAPAKNDNKPYPLGTKQAELKKVAIEAKLNGKAPGKVKEVAKGQYVQLTREGEGQLWTVLGEFADVGHNEIPGWIAPRCVHLGPGLQPGLLHGPAV